MNSTLTPTQKRPAAESEPQEQRRYVPPRVDITETKDGYVLEAEMPGVNKDGIEIALEGNELTIAGRRQEQPPALEVVCRESSGHDYRRTFVLDVTIDTSKIEAKIENGILRLSLPKAEEVKPRKIVVTE
jgi:HSP20 family protein